MEYFIVFFHVIFIAGGGLVTWRMSSDLDDKINVQAFLVTFILTILASISLLSFITGASW